VKHSFECFYKKNMLTRVMGSTKNFAKEKEDLGPALPNQV
jgi:hypothetical protein